VNLLKTRRNTDFFVKKNINCTIGKKCGLKLLAQKKEFEKQKFEKKIGEFRPFT
jgi:hypothetical protein